MKRYMVGKIVEKDGEKVLDGVTMNRCFGIIGTGVFLAGTITCIKKGKVIAKSLANKLNLNDKIEKIKTSININ